MKRPCIERCGRYTETTRCIPCERARRKRAYDNPAYRSLPKPTGPCQLRLPGCTGVSTTLDHIVPLSRGGTNQPSNVRGACAHCNYSRGNRNA
jgi:5-methylcytosine-specific restriction endonuclease McrA